MGMDEWGREGGGKAVGRIGRRLGVVGRMPTAQQTDGGWEVALAVEGQCGWEGASALRVGMFFPLQVRFQKCAFFGCQCADEFERALEYGRRVVVRRGVLWGVSVGSVFWDQVWQWWWGTLSVLRGRLGW